ncbi:MAG: ABC transporter ATP-binding protein [Armatimonadota bacterium]
MTRTSPNTNKDAWDRKKCSQNIPQSQGAEFMVVDGVSKHFGGLKAVDTVSFNLEEGSLAAVIGPNGAGKTTLFSLIAGAMPPTSGTVRFHGKAVRSPVRACRMGIARTFQNVRLFHDMTVLENVLVGMGHTNFCKGSLRLPHWVDEERLRMKRAYYLLEEVGMEGLAGLRAGDIPFGQQRLLEIARALALEPKLLLLDEPAAGLNRTETTALGGLIRRIRDRGLTILLVEHDMHLVMNLAERVIVLDSGQQIADGTPAEVRADARVCAAYLGAPAC